MKTYEVIKIPDPVLKQIAQPIETITPEIVAQMKRMVDTMIESNGIGLAANQVGLLNRVIIVDESCRDEGKCSPLMMANPKIIKLGDKPMVNTEGCLSIPEEFADVERPEEVTVSYIDETGTQKEISATGLLSACLQHEIDHLDGVLFIDHISRLKRERLIKRFFKNQKISDKAVL